MKINIGNKFFFISPILLILFSGVIVRLMLASFGTLNLDQGTFIAWSNILNDGGLKNFYNSWSDYLPGYLYVLWLLGKINSLSIFPTEILYKLPAIFSDLLTGAIIYLILKKYVKEKTALLASAAYIFNPAVWANSSLWGQVDSLTALFSLAAIWLSSLSPIASALALSMGTLIKPQAALAAGVVLFLMLKNRWRWTKVAGYILLSLMVFILPFWPFAGEKNIILFISDRISATLNQYPYSSINAFSFWGFFGFWKAEGRGLLSTNTLGIAATLAVFMISWLKIRQRNLGQYWMAGILFLASFLFFSRMHERHLLFALAPLAVVAAVNPLIWFFYAGLSLSYVANLYYSYVWITDGFRSAIPEILIKFFILANIFFLAAIFKEALQKIPTIVNLKLLNFFRRIHTVERIKFPGLKISPRRAKIYLALVLAFALVGRLLFLNHPEKEYFDEVYHAFTARIMLHGDPKAWEWWNPHPEGFAYEWTHPPLAKEGMVLGMLVFGENSFGWRFPGAILGVGAVLLIYLIAKHLFKDEALALFSAAVFSLDGLPLVMSRIAMNDSYILFFALLSVYLYFKDKNFFSALAFGLALASKWSALWAIPIFLLAHFVLKKKFSLSYLWFVILPPLVYLASYVPMFVTGHSLDIFWGMQKQMWWYHTNLEATHPYTSAWYSWPLLLRPIWLYVDYLPEKIENIYAMGNPLVFWTGLASVFVALFYAFQEKIRSLALVVFAYLIFFVPWALSPRIMFFYHYQPSLPFLAIATGFLLRKNPKLATPLLIIFLLAFIYFYPHWTGLAVSKSWDNSYYWLSSWR